MALSLQLSSVQSCDCKTITLTDATGPYSAVNTGGWGSPNQDPTDINCAYLSILLPGDTVPFIKDITSVFTGSADDLDRLIFEVTMQDCGATSADQFSDGIIDLEYHVGTTSDDPTNGSCTEGTLAHVDMTLPLYCVVQCCILSKIALIPQYYCCDKCNNAYVQYCFDLWMMLKSLQTADVTISSVQFENILEQVQKLCNNEDCSCV